MTRNNLAAETFKTEQIKTKGNMKIAFFFIFYFIKQKRNKINVWVFYFVGHFMLDNAMTEKNTKRHDRKHNCQDPDSMGTNKVPRVGYASHIHMIKQK